METKEDLLAIYDPILNKTPLGANKCEEMITFGLSFPSHFNVFDVFLTILDDSGCIYKELTIKEKSVSLKIEKAGIYWYYFRFSDCYGTHFLVPKNDLKAKISNSIDSKWLLSIYIDSNDECNWFSDGVIYQIFPDRFYHSKLLKKDNIILHDSIFDAPLYGPQKNGRWNIDFYGGNLEGIIEKLDYLKSLNVSSIYLNPIFLSPSNHRYDTSDYMMIDPLLGTEEDYIKLCQKAKEKGIRIIIDMVFNHTGDDSIYFNKYGSFSSIGAYQSKKSPYYDWYDFSTNYKNGYRCWWDVSSLPSINQNSPSYLKFIEEVCNKWISLGASGVRLDVVDELDDHTVETIGKACKKANPNAIIIGEVWENAAIKIAYNKRRHYFLGKELDTVMNYCFAKSIIAYVKDNDYNYLYNTIRMILNDYPSWVQYKLMNILDTHDTYRLINYFYKSYPTSEKEMKEYTPTESEKKIAYDKLKKASLLQFTLFGVPCIYYGDEVGLDGFSDPYSRKHYPWGREDEKLLKWYQTLGKLRKERAIVKGSFQEISFNDKYIAFERIWNDEKVLVVINNFTKTVSFDKSGTDLLSGDFKEKIEVKYCGVFKLKE